MNTDLIFEKLKAKAEMDLRKRLADARNQFLKDVVGQHNYRLVEIESDLDDAIAKTSVIKILDSITNELYLIRISEEVDNEVKKFLESVDTLTEQLDQLKRTPGEQP
jgi:vacuolar-type H+-ATPase subunit E/Vma4